MNEENRLEKNKTRRMIFNHILQYPGVEYSILKRVINIPESTLRYHLQYLEKHNKILNRHQQGKRCFFPSTDVSLSEKEPFIDQTIRNQSSVLKIIKRSPGITQKELIQSTRLKRSTISSIVNRLNSQQLIRCVRQGKNTTYYHVNEKDQKQELLRKLVVKLVNNEIDENTFNMLKNYLEEA